MSLCNCPERPRCGWDWCPSAADWSIYQPPWGKRRSARFKFMCEAHAAIYRDGVTKPIKGIDRPVGADEDWRGSLVDCVHHARIALEAEEQKLLRGRRT